MMTQEIKTESSSSTWLKKAIPIIIGLLIIMPMIGVGVVYFTTSAEKARRLQEVQERAAMEAARRAELREQAGEPAPKPERPTLPHPQPKDG